MEASLVGFRAKIDRAIEQLEAPQGEVTALGQQPNPYGIVAQIDREGGHYVFRLSPAWEPGRTARWGVIVGEIVHDLRSGLDHLVWEALVTAGVRPDREHAFPILATEPEPDFTHWATRTWRIKGHDHHGPLCGAPLALIDVAERCQPYHGGHTATLMRLNQLWTIDKHHRLIPMLHVMPTPTLELRDVANVERPPDRYESGAYVVEVRVEYVGPDPHVDVQASAPVDITLGQTGLPVIHDLTACARFMLAEVLGPFWIGP